jgi:hypothetical protein
LGYEAVDGRRLLHDALNVRRNRNPTSELIPELLNSEIKASLEGADVILRLRLIDAPLDQCHIETVAEPARALFKSLQHVADLTGVTTVSAVDRIYTSFKIPTQQMSNESCQFRKSCLNTFS